MKTFKTFVVISLLLASSGAWAYSTPNVPVDDPVYRDIDKLVASGLVKDVIYGQRPWSRREIARIVAIAMSNIEKNPPMTPDDREISERVYNSEIVERLKERFHDELVDADSIPGDPKNIRVNPLEEVRFDYTLMDSPFRAIPVDNGLGLINGVVNPLVAYREGRHYVDGSTLAFETTHTAKLSRFFSLYLQPRFEGLVPNTGGSDFNPLIQRAYGKFAYRNFEVEAGRDSLIWGQGEFGGLMFSNNARPLDMIKLTSSAPFYHPWIFRYLGPSKYTFFIANLGPESSFKNSFLYGFRVAIRPVSFLELGFDHSIILGGDGAPALDWFDPIGEFFFVRRGGLSGTGSQVADHRFGADWRLRIPPLRNTEWYFETLWDDFGRQSVATNITQQMAFVTGIYVPRLNSEGNSDLRLEFSHIPPILYRHSFWTSGFTLNRLMLGNELGPDSDRARLTFRHDFRPGHVLTLETAYGNMDGDTYTQTLSSKGQADRVVKVTDGPTEHRWVFQGGFLWEVRRDVTLNLLAGYEHVWNLGFVLNHNVDNFMGGFSVSYKPGWF
ncbi:MAG TPA: capsule assembly Wzi family protein [bacterium]|nr:capsule assembly Wzi family protein [bacterium]